MVRDSMVQAPSSDGPSAHAKRSSNVLLKNAVGFQLTEKTLIRAAVAAR